MVQRALHLDVHILLTRPLGENILILELDRSHDLVLTNDQLQVLDPNPRGALLWYIFFYIYIYIYDSLTKRGFKTVLT